MLKVLKRVCQRSSSGRHHSVPWQTSGVRDTRVVWLFGLTEGQREAKLLPPVISEEYHSLSLQRIEIRYLDLDAPTRSIFGWLP
jgi:hypothetical protein